MKCTDCNGNKIYEGLGHYGDVREPCRRCEGSGEEPANPITKRLGMTGTPIRGSALASRTRATTGQPELVTKGSGRSASSKQSPFPDLIRLEETQDGYFKYQRLPDSTLVRVTNVVNGPHWVMLGTRSGGGAMSKIAIGWDTAQQSRKAMLDLAQDHYLTLYERVKMDNKFRCLWHY